MSAAVALAVTLAAPPPVAAGSPTCTSAPLAGCRVSRVPEQTRIWLHDQTVDRRDTIVWKWRRGETTSRADFGDPEHSHGYAMCIYAANGSSIFRASVPSGGTCNVHPCWKTSGGGYKYRDGMATADGLTKVLLFPGTDGKAGVVVKGRGPLLELPSLPLATPITVQLQEENGRCWSATYEPSGVRLNDGEVFRAGAAH